MRMLPNTPRMILMCSLLLVATQAYAQTENQGQLPTLPSVAAEGAPTTSPTLPATAAPVPQPMANAPAVNLPPTQAAAPVAAEAPSQALAQQPPTAINAPIAAADAPALVGAIAPSASKFSFGDSDVSILFLPPQIQVMKQALTNYESRPLRSAPVETVKEQTLKLDVIAEPQVSEPEKYPVFYLSSIVYHSASDWSLWVSGHKITSAKNPTDIKVKGISPDHASFEWAPGYSEALALRKQHKTFAETDKVKHRLSAIQNSSYDENTGLVTFTLRPNQTFAVGYFRTFEGYMESPKLEPALPADAAIASPTRQLTPQTVQPQREPPSSMDEVLKPKTIGDVIHSREDNKVKGAE